jgi:hypothetical protein
MTVFSEELQDGRYSLHGVVVVSDDGVQLYIGGGEKTHIGSVAVSQPRESLSGDGSVSCTTSVLNLVGHKDDAISMSIADRLCRVLNRVVVVTAGVHIGSAEPKEIERLLANARRLTETIIARLGNPGKGDTGCTKRP